MSVYVPVCVYAHSGTLADMEGVNGAEKPLCSPFYGLPTYGGTQQDTQEQSTVS